MGFFEKLKSGLSKTKNTLTREINSLFSGLRGFDEDFFEELEETLILADVGTRLSMSITEELREVIKDEKIKEAEVARQRLFELLSEKLDKSDTPLSLDSDLSVVLVIGVNGVGKTTSIAKIASYLKGQGEKVILAAADTFRAAAIDQLGIWADRVGVEMIKQSEGSDPAAVVFDAIGAAKKKGASVLIVDTAGRLHNKKNLMDELAKIDRVINRELPGASRETLLVLDATTGQNAVNQAKEFKNSANITGLVLTKLDGTARGGIIFSVKEELGVPVKFIGVGEGVEDLRPFEPDAFVKALFEE
ncbi:MAG: signal recognition particle-docking protein FtsY [Ruminococcaceae bacterium]|nr:signal recognition particle-docking protein FtsY [Oscillospiraceae bacterium]